MACNISTTINHSTRSPCKEMKTNETAPRRKTYTSKGRPKGSRNLARNGCANKNQTRRIRFKVLTHEDLSDGIPAAVVERPASHSAGRNRSSLHSGRTRTDDTASPDLTCQKSIGLVPHDTVPLGHARDTPFIEPVYHHSSSSDSRGPPTSAPPLEHLRYPQQGHSANIFSYYQPDEDVAAYSQQPPTEATEMFPQEWSSLWADPSFLTGWWPTYGGIEVFDGNRHGSMSCFSQDQYSLSSGSGEEQRSTASTETSTYLEPTEMLPRRDSVHPGCPDPSEIPDDLTRRQSADFYQQAVADFQRATGNLAMARSQYQGERPASSLSPEQWSRGWSGGVGGAGGPPPPTSCGAMQAPRDPQGYIV